MSTEPYIAVVNLLPLSRYAQIMGLDLAHIMQVGGSGYPVGPVCSNCWTESMRQQLRLAIASAEEMIAEQLGFPVGATYTEERQRFPWQYKWAGGNNSSYRNQVGRNGWPTIHTAWKRLLTMGSVSLEEITDFTFTWSCPDANAVNALGTISFAPPAGLVDLGRIRVFHLYPFYGGRWQEIEGLRTRLVNGNVVIDGFREQWVLPMACGYGLACVDWDDNGNFVADEDDLLVYYEVDHPENAVCYFWALPEGCTPGCVPTSQRACAQIVNHEGGVVQSYPATWDGTALTRTCCADEDYPPDYAILRYRAGWADPLRSGAWYSGTRLNVDRFGSMMAMAIVRLANTLLPAHIRCGCKQAQEQWQNDRLLVGQGNSSGTNSTSRPMLAQAEKNPFGPTYGALAAWQMVRPRIAGGAAVT